MGALVMAHSDDEGLISPPKLAPIQVVIVPIFRSEEDLAKISEKANQIKDELKAKGISVKFDNRDTHKPGWKFAEYEMQGVPVRIAMGMRDLENGTVEVARRDTKEKMILSFDDLVNKVEHLMEAIQDNIYQRALTFREENSHNADTYDEFKDIIENKGGFVYAHWDGTTETEEKIQEETKATIRCIPFNQKEEDGKCIYSGKPSKGRVVFAKAY